MAHDFLMRFSDLSSTVDCLSNKIVYRNQIGEKRWLKKLKSKMEATLFIWLFFMD
jgi:hypothetical protein